MKRDRRQMVGMLMVIFGALFLMEELGISSVIVSGVRNVVAIFWPLVIIWMGLRMRRRKTTQSWGNGLILIGILLVLSKLFMFSFWGVLWPVLIIVWGMRWFNR